MLCVLRRLLILVLAGLCAGKFDPYVDNGGTVVCVAGKDYCVIAADTRLSDQYLIRSRKLSRIFAIESGLVFTGSGCWADTLALSKDLKLHAQEYQLEHGKKLAIRPLAYLLSSQLYSRRFFPYYTFCTVAGLDREGRGAVYRYDAVGSNERVAAVCTGKGEHLIQPLLDEVTNMEEDQSLWELSEDGENAFISQSLISGYASGSTGTSMSAGSGAGGDYGGTTAEDNKEPDLQQQAPHEPPTTAHEHASIIGSTTASNSGVATSRRTAPGPYVGLPLQETCDLVLRAFRAAAEREITIGDGVEMWVLTKNTAKAGTSGSKDDSVERLTTGVRVGEEATLERLVYSVVKRHYALPAH